MGRDKEFNRTEKEGKLIKMLREYTSQMMHTAIAYHPVTHAQPVPK